jgi:hypothetical protein
MLAEALGHGRSTNAIVAPRSEGLANMIEQNGAISVHGQRPPRFIFWS